MLPTAMMVEGIEHIGEVGDGKCRHRSAHQAIASKTRKPVITYGFFLLCKHMRDKQAVMIKDIHGNDQRGTIISIERKDNNNSDWIVRMEKPNAPGQFYGFTVRTV